MSRDDVLSADNSIIQQELSCQSDAEVNEGLCFGVIGR